jgi:hypothetical protein
MRKYILITFIIAILLAFFLPFQFLLNFAHDDSFFYIKTASNFSKGLGSTFDGINLSNGYHPLYFISLALLFFIPNLLLNPSPEFLYRIVVLYHFILIIGIQIYIFKALRNIYKNEFGIMNLCLLLALFFSFVFIRDFGLESHLGCLLVSVFLYIKSKELCYGEDYIFKKALLLALLFLTRSDYIYSIIPFIFISDFFICEKRKKYLIVTILFLLFSFVSYYTTNYVIFGHFGTVSGKILNYFPKVRLKDNIEALLNDPGKIFNQFTRFIFVIAAFVILFIYYIKIKNKKEIIPKFLIVILGFGIGSIVFAFIHISYNFYGLREWYMTTPVLIAIIMVVIFTMKNKYLSNISLVLSVLILVYVFYGSRIKNYKFETNYLYAKTLNSIVKENESIFKIDFCGIIGFFSDRKVINGDGLINSFEYLNYFNGKKIKEYIAKNKIDYYSTFSSEDLFKDSVYVDNNFADKTNGEVFVFPKSSLVAEQRFEMNHIAYTYGGNWYLFKFKY